MKKTELYKIIGEELRLALEGCGYTHTVKGKKLKTSGGTNDDDIKKESNGQEVAKENAGIELGFKYMNKYNTAPGDTVGTINAEDEDPSDEHSQKQVKEGKLNESEGYVEIMDMMMHSDSGKNIKRTLEPFIKMWHKWKNGPATERNMINPAKKDLIDYVNWYLNKSLK